MGSLTVKELLLLADERGLQDERNALFIAWLKLMEKLNGQRQAETEAAS
jgi:hypothetical protein